MKISPDSQGLLSADPSFGAVKRKLIQWTGLAYWRERDEELSQCLRRRMHELGVRDCAEYLEVLEREWSAEREVEALATALTIGETYFFRDPQQFEVLKEVVFPHLLRKNRDSRRLRIWSAGCSTGAEAYSVSLLLRRELALWTRGWEICIIGTDINSEFLSQARRARYSAWSLRAVDEEVRNSCFRPCDKEWELKPVYRRGVSFFYHNLARHPFPFPAQNLAGFDLILCRNVLIYFDRVHSREITGRLADCLAEEGWLVVSAAEYDPEGFQNYRPVSYGGVVVFQKAGRILPEPVPALGPEHLGKLLPVVQPAQRAVPAGPVPLRPGVRPVPEPGKDGPVPAGKSEAESGLRALLDAGHWEEAARRCGELLEADSLNCRWHFYQGLIEAQQGRWRMAENWLRRALYLDRKFVAAHYCLGLLYYQQEIPRCNRSFHNVLRLLSATNREQVFPELDGMTAGALESLVRRQLEVLQE